MRSVVVHRGSPEAVISVVHHLQQAGIEARVIDQPNFVVLMMSFGTYKSRVVVPEDEAQAAAQELARWSESSRAEVESLGRQLRVQVLLSCVASVLASGWAVKVNDSMEPGFLLAVALPSSWLLAFLLQAIVRRLLRPGPSA